MRQCLGNSPVGWVCVVPALKRMAGSFLPSGWSHPTRITKTLRDITGLWQPSRSNHLFDPAMSALSLDAEVPKCSSASVKQSSAQVMKYSSAHVLKCSVLMRAALRLCTCVTCM